MWLWLIMRRGLRRIRGGFGGHGYGNRKGVTEKKRNEEKDEKKKTKRKSRSLGARDDNQKQRKKPKAGSLKAAAT